MNYKLLKYKTILFTSVAEFTGSCLSDELLFNDITSIGLSPNYFEDRKKTYYLFYNQVEYLINSITFKNKLKQLLNYKLKSNIKDSGKEAVHRYWINL